MMVTRWGLSDALGTVAYGENQEECSSAIRWRASRTSRKRPAENRRRDQALCRGRLSGSAAILTEKRADLETLAKGLLEFETLTGDEIKDLLMGKRPIRSTIEPTGPRASTVPTAGRGRNRPRPEAGPMEPQPQA